MPRKSKAQREAEAAAKDEEQVRSEAVETSTRKTMSNKVEEPKVEEPKLEKVSIPRASISEPPPPTPKEMTVAIIMSGAGYRHGEVHTLPGKVAQSLIKRKIAIRQVD